jgi:hypothetical protein
MDYLKVLVKYYKNNEWNYEENYESLDWKDTNTLKPTKEELDVLILEIIKDEMREERNQLLKESDFTVLPDFPSTNKQAWLDYRQQLRDFPSEWDVGLPFPSKPIF